MPLADWRRQQSINLEGVFLGIKWRRALDARKRRRIDRQHIVGRGPERIGVARRLLRNEGRRSAVHESGCAGVRPEQLEYPRELGAPGRNRHADLADDVPSTLQPGANTLDAKEIAAARCRDAARVGAEDIANGVLFLASDESSYISGTELVIDSALSA